jgi:hypothetical protein
MKQTIHELAMFGGSFSTRQEALDYATTLAAKQILIVAIVLSGATEVIAYAVLTDGYISSWFELLGQPKE